MPTRIVPFVDGEYYHCFNKTISGDSIFLSPNITKVFQEIVWFYRSKEARLRYSHFARLSKVDKEDVGKVINNTTHFNANILAYVMMPNHFHFILRQNLSGSIENMMRNTLISFTRYFNVLHKRKGPLFLTQFKAVRIRSQDQLLHTTRYLHLNYYSSGTLTDISRLTHVPSSYHVYVNGEKDLLVDYGLIVATFGERREQYKKFVEENAEYQKTLDYIKHTKKWNL